MTRILLVSSICIAMAACGPSRNTDKACVGTDCASGTCNSGDVRDCYTGDPSTDNVGLCHGGMQTCNSAGQWDTCEGQVVPTGEVCGDNQDNDCDGQVDEDTDNDGDGYTTCQGDCCDDPTECSNPGLVNPGAFDVAGNGVDDDCDGVVDNPPQNCDSGLSSSSSNGMDYAKAIDLCQQVDANGMVAGKMYGPRWGVVSATLTKADGTALDAAQSVQHSIRPHYGTGTQPQAGASLIELSSGNAAATADSNPGPDLDEDGELGASSAFPSDWYTANGSKLPNAPGCPAPSGDTANDPVMLTLTIRVPTNASSFSLGVNFFSSEFPEWTCSPYNDFFVVLLDSMWSGMPANPTDKNLALYTQTSTMKKYPVGVNLAFGNTGLFTQCINGAIGCDGTAGTIATCMSTAELAGTGMDQPDLGGGCSGGDTELGGGTGWLTTTGNVKAGEMMKLRIAIWDTSDDALDSLAVIDNFLWSVQSSDPGTVIQRTAPVAGTSVEPVSRLAQ